MRDHAERVDAAGLHVLGISFDNIDENRAFAEKFELPFRLLSDSERTMGLAYGACDKVGAGYARRYTFVIGPDGCIEHAIDTKDPGGQAAALLELL